MITHPQTAADPIFTAEHAATQDHQMLIRLRTHGLIERIPGIHRYQVTNQGLRHALFLTRAHTRLLRTRLTQLHDPPGPSTLRTAARTYETAITDLTRTAGLAA